MRPTALILLVLSLARSAQADLTVDSNYSGNMLMWRAKTRMHEQIRDDRSRVEMWSTEIVDVSEHPKHTIDIVRADRHLRWALEPDSMIYREYPWPDTIETQAPDPDDLRERAMADSMAKASGAKDLPRKTGEHQVINGMPSERFYLEIAPAASELDSRGRGASELEIWALVGNQNKEIHRLQEVATRHSLLSHPRSELDPMTSTPVDPWAEVDSMVPIRATFKVAMMDSAEVHEMSEKLRGVPADSLKAAQKEVFEDIDFATGKLTMFQINVIAIHLGPVPDHAFDIPPGYKKAATLPRGRSPR